ncbi:LysR family transcriptional regulator [Dactylosporangium sp. NBC_01737]|uniref:LysR family transcriptional regulator n=1 Tax=Dactylosporangium sp. NBC_01737 TaxID=2975959 RepID=UPI002E0F7BB1|nr:LysR family transcriptional regulator [Dactylosporangium sp. NBC_01737]
MPEDLDIRLLRHFVAVAEELHFSRAARRLFLAQQALSRDIQRLEDRAGVRLLDRTTRRVVLTPAGHTLLRRARELLALHDTTLRELHGEPRSLTVDVVGAGLTPALVLAAARHRAPQVEYFARFHTGTEDAVPLLLAERLDVTFGRAPHHTDGLRHRPVRNEPLAVLLPADHPLAAHDAVPLHALRGAGACYRAGSHATPGWEHAILQLLAPFGIEASGAHPHVHGTDELAQHLVGRSGPILVMSTQPAVPGGVLRPIVDPVPLFPWAMIWRVDADDPGLRALHTAVDELAPGWPAVPADPRTTWLPAPESGSP